MPAGLQIRIVPGPRSEPDRYPALALGRAPIGVECVDHVVNVTHRGGRGVGVPAIGNHLHIGLLAREQPALKVLIDLNHQ